MTMTQTHQSLMETCIQDCLDCLRDCEYCATACLYETAVKGVSLRS